MIGRWLGGVSPKVVAAFAAIYLIWGSTFLFVRFALETMPPFVMAGTRTFVAGGLLYGWARLRGVTEPARAYWPGAALTGVLMIVGGTGGVALAERMVSSGLTAVLVAVVPLWTVLLEWLWFGGARPGGRMVAGLALGMTGMVLLVGPGRLAGEGDGVSLVGVGVILVGTLLWSLGSLLSPRARLPDSFMLATGMQMLAGSAALLALSVVTGQAARLEVGAVSALSALSLGYLTVFGSVVGFSAYAWLLRATSPIRVSSYAYVNPVVAVLFGWVAGGEALTPRMGVASVMIVTAVVLIVARRERGKAGGPVEPAAAASS